MKILAHVLILLPFFSFGVVGCTHSIYVAPFNSSNDDGLVYFLPKTAIKVNLIYTLRETTKLRQGIEYTNSTVLISKPVEIVPIMVPDNNNIFVLSAKDISQNIILESGLEFKLTDNGILTAIEADVKDKTLETAEKLVSAGVKIASIAAIAGEKKQVPDELKDVVEGINDIYAKYGEVLLSANKDKKSKLTTLKEELDNANAIVEIYKQKNKESYKETDINYSVTLDTDEFEYNSNEKVLEYKISPDQLIKGKFAANMPPVVVKLKITDSASGANKIYPTKEKSKGIIYKIGKPVLTTVCVNAPETEIFRDYIVYPQYGTFAKVMVDSKGSTDRKTSIVFSDKTGGITNLKITSGSSADKIMQTINNSLENIQKAIVDVRYDLKIQDMEKQKSLLDAEKNLLEAKKAYEDAKKASEEE